MIEELKRGLEHWQGRSRRELLRPLRDAVWRHADAWVDVCCGLKHLDPRTEQAGQEWAVGPGLVLRHLRLLAARPASRFPASLWDAVLYPRLSGWCETGGSENSGPGPGRVGLVLGAGNVSAIAATDVLHKIFAEEHAVILKLSPLCEPLLPVWTDAFAPLLEANLLRIVCGDAAAGEEWSRHPEVQWIHVTGSAKTAERLQHTGKHVTSELGCVTPVVVVPGSWSERQLQFQARHVALMLTHNGGFNCNTAQVLVLCRRWPQRDAFMSALREALRESAPAHPLYTDAPARQAVWCERYPQAERFRPHYGPVLVADVAPEAREPAFREEAFCCVLFETSLDTEPTDFFSHAAQFVNQNLWGDLSCAVLVHPADRGRQSFLSVLSGLRYGAVGINLWPAMIYALVQFPWGAYGGSGTSGNGMVHNTFRIHQPLRSVLEAPFEHPLRMPWQVGYTRMGSLARSTARFEYRPSLWNLLRAHWHFFRGALRM